MRAVFTRPLRRPSPRRLLFSLCAPGYIAKCRISPSGRSNPPESHRSLTSMPKSSIAAKFAIAVACGLLVCSASTLFAEDKPCNYPPKDAADKDGWISLFNGKDLTGWKLSENSKIHVEDGKIVCAGFASHAFTDWQFKNFIFEADVQTHPHANSG